MERISRTNILRMRFSSGIRLDGGVEGDRVGPPAKRRVKRAAQRAQHRLSRGSEGSSRSGRRLSLRRARLVLRSLVGEYRALATRHTKRGRAGTTRWPRTDSTDPGSIFAFLSAGAAPTCPGTKRLTGLTIQGTYRPRGPSEPGARATQGTERPRGPSDSGHRTNLGAERPKGPSDPRH